MVSCVGAAAVMFFIGAVIALSVELSFELLFVLMFILVAVPLSFCATIFAAKKMNVGILFVIPAFLFVGMTVTTLKTTEKLRPLYPYVQQQAELIGCVSSISKESDGLFQFMLEVKEIKTNNGSQKINETIKISTDKNFVTPSDSIRVTGKLKSIASPKNSSSFNAKRYYARQGIYFSMYADTIQNSPYVCTLSLKNRISLFINVTMDNYINQFSASTAAFVKGIVLNNKSSIPDETTEQMLKCGTYRYIYCPYIHISILLYLLYFVVHKKRRYFLSGVLIFSIYLFMNFSAPSAWRICLFFIMSYILTRTMKIYNFRMVFYMTILVAGLLSPLTITEPGFVISMTCVALVKGLSRELSSVLAKIIRNRPLAHFLALFLIVLVGLYPMCSYMGMNMTPWSVVLGLIITPLITLIYALFYTGFFIFSICGIFLPLGIGHVTKAVEIISQYASYLPFATINTGRCSLLFVIAFYSIIYCIYLRLQNRTSLKGEILTGLICFVFAVSFLPTLFTGEITFLSVGNADCCIIRLPGNHTVMIDGGGSPEYSDYDIGKAEVIPYLASNGINKIDSILVSHYDKDHADGVITVMRTMAVDQIFIPDYLPNNDLRDIIEAEALAHNIKVNHVSQPGEISLSKDLSCQILLCDKTASQNDNSLVAKVMYGQVSVLFPGDISVFAESKLVDTKADILKVAHHGSITSTGERFIKNTDPKYCIISVGENNPYGHPAPAVLNRCVRQGSTVLRTDMCGDIHFIIKKEGIKRVYTFKE